MGRSLETWVGIAEVVLGAEHIAIDDDRDVRAAIDEFLSGERSLTGLQLYYHLERVTSLLGFHAMIRQGPQNATRSGLQQSYGDHNRLLMLGLDKLVEGDVDWLRSRLDEADTVSDGALDACLAQIGALGLERDVLVALWLAGAMHDCGMLGGRGSYVDVEDGLVLSRGVIDGLCPPPLRDLAYFVLRHHDYIKDVFLGEVPVSLVAEDLDRLEPALQPTALAALGIVQVAGAASLGEGRLSQFRIDLCDRCLAGDALDDRSAEARLARLLADQPSAAPPVARPILAELDGFDAVGRERLERFLASASLHGWHRQVGDGRGRDDMMRLLAEIATLWDGEDAVEHVVLEASGERGTFRRVEVSTALSGSRLLLLAA